jgi:hypothetical protein
MSGIASTVPVTSRSAYSFLSAGPGPPAAQMTAPTSSSWRIIGSLDRSRASRRSTRACRACRRCGRGRGPRAAARRPRTRRPSGASGRVILSPTPPVECLSGRNRLSFGQTTALVHRGFANALTALEGGLLDTDGAAIPVWRTAGAKANPLDRELALFEQVKKLVDGPPKRKLYITGHSLGGALATLAALKLEMAGTSPEAVYTIGSPRPAGTAFASQYDGRTEGPHLHPHQLQRHRAQGALRQGHSGGPWFRLVARRRRPAAEAHHDPAERRLLPPTRPARDR